MRAHKEAREAAERTGTEIRYYNIIYNLVDDVKAAMSGLLTPERRETMLGNAQILEIFAVSKVGKIAGCRVTDGKVERGANVRLIRDNVVIHEGKLSPAQALQGRRARGGGRPGMRHGVRELPGHARRRRDRVLSRGDGAAVALSPNLRSTRSVVPVMPGMPDFVTWHPGIRWPRPSIEMAGTSPAMTQQIFQAFDDAPTSSAAIMRPPAPRSASCASAS